MILHIYTIIHTLISFVAIFTGLIVLFGMLAGERLDGWTKWFPNHHGDERDRLLFSVPWFYACSWSWGHVPVGVGSCDLRALPASTRGRLALDLRRHGCDRALSERVCRGRADLPEEEEWGSVLTFDTGDARTGPAHLPQDFAQCQPFVF
jgi:hypothetical protein